MEMHEVKEGQKVRVNREGVYEVTKVKPAEYKVIVSDPKTRKEMPPVSPRQLEQI